MPRAETVHSAQELSQLAAVIGATESFSHISATVYNNWAALTVAIKTKDKPNCEEFAPLKSQT